MPNRLLQALVGDPETAALFTSEAEIAGILSFESALAQAEADAGLIPEAAATAIVAACASFTPDYDALAVGMARDGVVVPELVRQLRAAVGEHGKSVHLGATSQDAIDTSLVLRLAKAITLFEDRLAALGRSLQDLSARFGTQPLMGHTRMQQALPITVADKIGNWAEPLQRQLRALEGMRRSLLVIQLGGAVGTRDGLGEQADEIARRLADHLDLGFATPWHTQRDPLVDFASVLSLVTGALGKFGADVALLSQNEVAAIALAGGGGSSAMPHKSNPVKAEILVTLARFNAGQVGLLHQALVHEYERSGSAWTLEWMVLPQIVEATGAALRIANELVIQVSFKL
ncbi:3-carboxy-cis,cis-muconate cycloisomerase [Youhaiella tibetensis]|uniref:3-carboxy-cis,cis-muconate cycloisomerase n=1 Tax=Paradevosia tibetensis TaxID=1447062 RepID=A0A5B9DPW1_9HYPH|nr:3-carboxy-cis,cis-muconate cycloisomerase [Youhaiella tibetensis]QEE20598.1 3-carboxy-cis,cis-muconate cycloisomerase [Youhaiella tibetensis]GGF22712.1 3-carboxy-cis,cis-muconate cycloisomerase [Youhaiella tibetensis]